VTVIKLDARDLQKLLAGGTVEMQEGGIQISLAPEARDGAVPPFPNGMPRVDWDASQGPGARFSVLLAEDEPLHVMAGDSGLELVYAPGKRDYPWAGTIRAVRREAPPEIIGGPEAA
jgi:hypothetical protein